MYAIMKLEYETPIYDYFGFGALKGGTLKCRLDWAIPEKHQTEEEGVGGGGGGGGENIHV